MIKWPNVKMLIYVAFEDANKREACQAKGGVMVKINSSDQCVKLQIVK